jgi:hypothetical protein
MAILLGAMEEEINPNGIVNIGSSIETRFF